MTSHNEAAYAALIGIDWADQQHDYCLGVVGTQTVETGVIDARPEGVAAFINPLRKRFQGQPLALCLEQSKGALIHQLMAVDFIDIYPINPQAFAHFRKAFAVSGAKDDSTDAQLMWDYLLTIGIGCGCILFVDGKRGCGGCGVVETGVDCLFADLAELNSEFFVAEQPGDILGQGFGGMGLE